MKKGRLNADEKSFIISNAGKMPIEAIAAHLDRSLDTVRDYASLQRPASAAPATQVSAAAERLQIRQELLQTEAWRNLKQEFTADEIKFFEESYCKLMAQFSGDVLASEEIQVFQSCKFELLMSRNLKERKKARDDIEKLENMQAAIMLRVSGGVPATEDHELSLQIDSQLRMAKQDEIARTAEYTKLHERHEALMKSLKGQRDQRINKIQDSKVNFLSVLKDLANRDVQRREGRQMELIKLAGKAEYERLGRPHTYEDGNEDSPILSADTVDLGPAETAEKDADGDE